MRVNVHYTGQLAVAAGVKGEPWEAVENTTWGQVVTSLAQSRGGDFADLILDAHGRPRPSLLVVLDGDQAASGWANLPVHAVQTVVLMTPIAGG